MSNKIRSFFEKNTLRHFFTNNIGWKIASVLIGLVIWAMIANTQDTVITMKLSVPIVYKNEGTIVTHEGQKLLSLSRPQTMTVKVRTLEKNKGKISTDFFSCEADLSQQVGNDLDNKYVPVQVTQNGGSQLIIDYQCDDGVIVTMDRYTEKTFRVQYIEENSISDGMKIQGSIDFEPSEITVSGPESRFDNVVSVKAVVDMQDLSYHAGSICTKELDVEMYDANGRRISNSDGMLTMSAEKVLMEASVAVLRTVALSLPYVSGTPADGCRVTNWSYNTDSLTVYGLYEDLEKQASILIDPADVSVEGISSDQVYHVNLEKYLSSGVSLYSGSGEVEITVNVEHLQGFAYTIPSSEITLANTSDDCDYTILEPEITAHIRGYAADIAALSTAVLSPSISVEALGPGTYTLPVSLANPGVYYIDNEGMLYMTVVVKARETLPPETEPVETPDLPSDVPTLPDEPGTEPGTDIPEESTVPEESVPEQQEQTDSTEDISGPDGPAPEESVPPAEEAGEGEEIILP